jgi:hypothetical protein
MLPAKIYDAKNKIGLTNHGTTPISVLLHLLTVLHALVAQLVERVLGKDEVGGSNPLGGSILF